MNILVKKVIFKFLFHISLFFMVNHGLFFLNSLNIYKNFFVTENADFNLIRSN